MKSENPLYCTIQVRLGVTPIVSLRISPTGQPIHLLVVVDVADAGNDIETVPKLTSNPVIIAAVGIPVPRKAFPTAMPVKSVTPVIIESLIVRIPDEPYKPHKSRASPAIAPL